MNDKTMIDKDQLMVEAAFNGWEQIPTKHQPTMTSFRKSGIRLNFFVTTGTVAWANGFGQSYLYRCDTRTAIRIMEVGFNEAKKELL